jgi:hypothetical protein
MCEQSRNQMVNSLRLGVEAQLRNAIGAYLAGQDHLDEFAREVLSRLGSDLDAAKAFAKLKLKDESDERIILSTCIAADALARSFSKRIADVEETLSRMARFSEAVATLRTFVEQIASKRNDPLASEMLSFRIYDPPGSIEAMQRGLYLMAGRIEMSHRAAQEDALRFGATRNTGLAESRSIESESAETTARQNAAIGWLAEGVRRVTGKANLASVADLAQVILRTSLTEDRVRAAARTREREWRRS